ncbi:hypothetical protein FDECE_4316 [Fusarium decemcellulare]|nr:hypothetical protein FDECE_4316 [Fusarium decemcellulare]
MSLHPHTPLAFYRQATHPQQVLPPLTPAPALGNKTTLLEDGKTLFEKDVPIKLSKHTHWELPDPLLWCGEWGYSFLVVDPRGTWWSEGDASHHFSPEEGRDGYDIVEWAAQQNWSTGNLGWGGGVSYYAMSAYQTAVLRPPHLKALIIWEGISDVYREVNAPGGIPNLPFQQFWMNMTANGLGLSDDHAVASLEHPLFDEYWQSKVVDWSLIEVPVFAVTGWSSLGLHLRGTIQAWKKMSSPNKYLQIHGGREWSEFYKEENVTKQHLFWNRFLKDQPNEVDTWPRVEIDVRTSATESFRRAEPDFPPQAQLARYKLVSENKLRTDGDKQSQYVSFTAHKPDSVAFFDLQIEKPIEVSGYSSVTLFIQALHFPDVDLFVALQKLDKYKQPVKFYHSTQQLEADASFGWLRTSHRELDEQQSTLERPVHFHRKRIWLRPQDIVQVNVELWPTSTIWEAGDTLRLAVKGTTFTNAENLTQFKGPSHSFGEVKIWFGDEYQSELIVPVMPLAID